MGLDMSEQARGVLNFVDDDRRGVVRQELRAGDLGLLGERRQIETHIVVVREGPLEKACLARLPDAGQ